MKLTEFKDCYKKKMYIIFDLIKKAIVNDIFNNDKIDVLRIRLNSIYKKYLYNKLIDYEHFNDNIL